MKPIAPLACTPSIKLPIVVLGFHHLPVLERGEAPLEVVKSGLRIRIWLEHGLLFAMTAPQ